MSIDIIVHLPVQQSSRYKSKELSLQIPDTLTVLHLYAYLVQLNLIDQEKDYVFIDDQDREMTSQQKIVQDIENAPVIVKLKQQRGKSNLRGDYIQMKKNSQNLQNNQFDNHQNNHKIDKQLTSIQLHGGSNKIQNIRPTQGAKSSPQSKIKTQNSNENGKALQNNQEIKVTINDDFSAIVLIPDASNPNNNRHTKPQNIRYCVSQTIIQQSLCQKCRKSCLLF